MSYALNRMVDTGAGVSMSLLINYLLPRERLVDWINVCCRTLGWPERY